MDAGVLDLLSGDGGTAAALTLLRVSGLVWTAPVLSSRAIPAAVKTAVSVVLVIVLWPASTAALPEGAALTPLTVMSELVVGMALGLGAGIFVAAAESAGDMLAIQMGLSGASVLDPTSQSRVPVMGQFMGIFATSLLLASGAYLVVMDALATSFHAIPPGGAVNLQTGPLEVMKLGSLLLWLGLRFAAPVVAAMMVGNSILGVMARAVPQLNVLMVAFPVQIGIGLLVLAATLPLMATPFVDWSSEYGGLVERLLGALAAGGPNG